MQETPGAQSGWERGAPGQEQVRVNPKKGGPLPLTSCQLLIHFPNDEGNQPHLPPEPVGQQR